MYDELVKRLREADEKSMCGECGLNFHTGATKKGVLFAEAADAIEELRRSEAVALEYGVDEHNKRLNLERRYRWIPVTERLPIPEQNVLICTKRGKICVAMYEDGTMRENDSSWSWYEIEYAGWDEEEDCGIIPEGWWEHTYFHPDCEFDCSVDEPVTHWMPLPEPPKEET